MADWIAFFDTDHALYVNARHKAAHARLTGDCLRAYIHDGEDALDYGCGEAAYAENLARGLNRLLLCEAAPNLRERLAARVAKIPNIAVLAPDAAEALPDASLDVAILHSVSQYLSPALTDDLFRLFRRLLRPGGRLIVGDVVPPDAAAVSEALALLRFGAREGFLIAAFGGLARTALSDYSRLRRSAGLTRYAQDDMRNKLTAAGFAARRASRNIGHLQSRMTFVAEPV